MQHMHWRKYAAECLGTGTLTLAVLVSLRFPMAISTPLIAALTLGFFVYTIGSVSGAHINPAVTAGFWSVGKIEPPEAMKYMLSQVIGGLIAMFAFTYVLGDLPSINAASVPLTFVAEAVGTFLFLIGISAVVAEKVRPDASGIVIGGSLLLGILIASAASNGVLNPAVAIGIRSWTWAYITGPIIGAIAGCWFSRWLYR
ncbi:MAG: aquaporin [Candidatus Peribacteraceae bacterium]|nr:aquaporin [Candidatus Peribacteraceae bacterium]